MNELVEVDGSVVDAVLTASRTLIAVATQSLGAVAEETTLAQYRTLVVVASRGPQRLVDLAGALGVTASTAGRMCDRLVRKQLVRRHRSRADRRTVLISLTPAGRQIVDQATDRRKGVLADILGNLTPEQRSAIADAFRTFAIAAGEVPDHDWPRQRPTSSSRTRDGRTIRRRCNPGDRFEPSRRISAAGQASANDVEQPGQSVATRISVRPVRCGVGRGSRVGIWGDCLSISDLLASPGWRQVTVSSDKTGM